MKNADVFVHSGLDLEAWREPLLTAAGNPRAIRGGAGEINLVEGIRLLNVPPPGTTRASGDMHQFGNPHFWLGPENALTMASTIARRLSEIDSVNASSYESSLAAFNAQLTQKIEEWNTRLATASGVELVAYHDEWRYFSEFAGVTIEQFLEPKPGIPPGPKQLAQLQSYIEQHGVKAIVYTAVTPSKPAETLAKRTGVRTVEFAQGVGEIKAVDNYIALIEYNVSQLLSALGS